MLFIFQGKKAKQRTQQPKDVESNLLLSLLVVNNRQCGPIWFAIAATRGCLDEPSCKASRREREECINNA